MSVVEFEASIIPERPGAEPPVKGLVCMPCGCCCTAPRAQHTYQRLSSELSGTYWRYQEEEHDLELEGDRDKLSVAMPPKTQIMKKYSHCKPALVGNRVCTLSRFHQKRRK